MTPLMTAPGNFGLGAPELIVVFILLLTLFSAHRLDQAITRPERRAARIDLTPPEKQAFLVLGAILLVGIGILILGQ
jgi:hypothetical protein